MIYNATASGIISKIIRKEKWGYVITITDASNGREVVDIIPQRPELHVSEGQSIKRDQPLTSNPNVGRFGQADAEIVLQDPLRVQRLLFFLASVVLAQIFFVLKKKQFEKVQLSEMDFQIHGFINIKFVKRTKFFQAIMLCKRKKLMKSLLLIYILFLSDVEKFLYSTPKSQYIYCEKDYLTFPLLCFFNINWMISLLSDLNIIESVNSFVFDQNRIKFDQNQILNIR